MNWTSVIAATIPAIITGVVSYLLSIRTSKSEIDKIKEINKSEIEKLHLSQKHELEKLELEFQKKNESSQNEAGMNLVSTMFQTALDDPKKFDELDKMFNKR